MNKINKRSGHAIHTELVLLTSQAVGGVAAREREADDHHAYNEHHHSGQDGHQHLGLQPCPHPGGQLLISVRVAGQRRYRS